MLLGEIKDAAGMVFYRVKGEDNFVRQSIARKSKQAKENGLFTTLKTVSEVKPSAEAEAFCKDRELSQWALDWGLWDFGPFNPNR